MLQSIRDRSQGWFAGAIISAVIAAFALWGIHSYLSMGGGQTDTVAKVNGNAVSQTDLNTAYERLRQQQQMQLGADFVIDPQSEMQLKKQALNHLIMEKILSQAAHKEGYRVTMEEVQAALLSIPAFQVNGRFSRERFNEVLSGILYTEQSFLNELQITMLINQVRGGLINSAFALPDDVKTAIRLINQKRDFAYFIIPTTQFTKAIMLSDAEAQQYYKEHQAMFTAPEQVSIEYITLSLPQLAAQLHFSDVQLMQFYQNNLSNFTTPQRWRVAHILIAVPIDATEQQIAAARARSEEIAKQLQAGESFAKLAEKNSDDKLSARKGGELDWFSTGMIDPNFEKAVAKLKQIGDITSPTQTKYGFDIIKLLAVQKSAVQPFTQVRSQVEKAMAQQQAEQIFADNSDKLSNLTYANPTSLDVAAKTLGLQVKTTELFSRQGGKSDITQKRKIIDAAFSNDVLQGNNSNVIELDPDTLVVLRLKQHFPAVVRPFDKVRDQVIQQLKIQEAQQKAEEVGKKLITQLQVKKKNERLELPDSGQWKQVTEVGRYSEQIPTALLAEAFRMPRPNTTQPFTVAGYKLPNGDYAVVLLMKVHDGSIDNISATQQRIYREELENGYGQLDYALYTRDLVNKAKVAITIPKS